MTQQNRELTAIGLMSGTSLDGVDVALLHTDGEGQSRVGPTFSMAYPRMTKVWIQRAIKAALEGRDGAEEIAKATNEVTRVHIKAVQKLLEKNKIDKSDIDVIGFHGQTILHRPPLDKSAVGRTWQIGSGHILAEELHINVIDGFRQNDMAHGGEGAPFAPVYHAHMIEKLKLDHSVCVLNLGGVANITWLPANGDLMKMVAFDCGPGNGLIDEWVELQIGEAMDRDGILAAKGTVNEEVLAMMLLNPFLRRPAPKSLDRYDFKIEAVKDLELEDGTATLTAFTAHAIAKSVSLLPEPPGLWIAVGGGAHNPVLIRHLKDLLDAPIQNAAEAGWRADFLEAECFAYLAVRALRKLPLSYPKTTRVPLPLPGGVLHQKRI